MKILKRHNISSVIIGITILLAIIGPMLVTYDPKDFSSDILLLPSLKHFLGTDQMGRDIFSNLIHGTRGTLIIALTSSTISTFIGVFNALIAAYYGGFIERVVDSMTDVFILIPEILVILTFAIYSKPSDINVIIAISLFSWSKAVRIIKERIKVALTSDTIAYTMLLKGNLLDILKKLWNYIYPVVISIYVLQFSKSITYEASLSFLGIGDATSITWGKLIKDALSYEGIFYGGYYLWYLLPAIICVVALVVSVSNLSFDN